VTLVSLLMLVLIAVLAWWLITKFITAQPLQTIILGIVGVILLLVLLQGVGVLGNAEGWRLHLR
jgi:hypothetical protein